MPSKTEIIDKLMELVSVVDDEVPEQYRSRRLQQVLRKAANFGNIAQGRPDLVQPELEEE